MFWRSSRVREDLRKFSKAFLHESRSLSQYTWVMMIMPTKGVHRQPGLSNVKAPHNFWKQFGSISPYWRRPVADRSYTNNLVHAYQFLAFSWEASCVLPRSPIRRSLKSISNPSRPARMQLLGFGSGVEGESNVGRSHHDALGFVTLSCRVGWGGLGFVASLWTHALWMKRF